MARRTVLGCGAVDRTRDSFCFVLRQGGLLDHLGAAALGLVDAAFVVEAAPAARDGLFARLRTRGSSP